MQVWDIPVIVVSRNYLGSINHTLLTLEVLQQRGIPIAGVVFNGESTPMSEEAISRYTRIPVLGHVPLFDACTPDVLRTFAEAWRPELLRKLHERHPLNVDVELKKRLLIDKKESHPRAAFS
jgi:dethiobiotin synthetase